MTCPQCNADIPDTTPYCPQCGSAIRQVAFSYLPAGAPAWPTTIPPLPLAKTGTADQTTEQNRDLTAAKPARRPPRSARGILILIAILVLTPLLGAGATFGYLWANGQFAANAAPATVRLPAKQTPGTNSTPNSTSGQLPTPTSFQTAKSSAIGVTLKYPSDWVADAPQQSSSGNTSINFHPQQQQLPVDLGIGRLSSKNSASVTGTNIVNQANIQGFGTDQNLQNLQLLTNTPQHAKIGGISWDEENATFTDSNGGLIHVVSLSVQHNKLYYNIFFFAPSNIYDEAVQKYYSQMLNSFQFQT